MGYTPCKLHLLLFLILFCIASLVHARLNLDPSDSDAISLIKKELGFTGGQQHPPENHCYSSVGIFCERRRRISGDSQVLRVTRIVLDSKRLNGFLSPTLGRLSELKELSLSNNLLVQQIPSEIVDCRKLEVLNLRNNRFSGKIPPEFSSLVSLRSLDLSSNKFSGDLSFLKYFPNLENLSLADNLFAGKIPMSLRSFRNLRFLNLSGNSYLQGSLPESMTTKIEYSGPSLSSENILPKRYIFAEKKNSTKNNHDSAIAPSAEAPSPSAVHHKKGGKHKNPKTKSWIFGFLVGGGAGVISGSLLSVLFKLVLVCMRERAKEPGPMIFSPKIKKIEVLAFLEKEDGMASLELIGRGGCGEVYRAELPGSNGTMIAIKKIIQPSGDAAELNDEDSRLLNRKMRQVQSEIKTVGQIRHRNLLPLLAHVPRPDCHFLIYEYMKNGSLQDALEQVSRGTKELDWLVRHRISIGIAAGLEYLHIHHSPRIIHRDLKPGNILLDDNMEARIADFGLAKAVPDAYSHVTTNNVAGTVGFIAPEYHQMLKFTDKCDIYSFGVLLAALVTGKLPSDEFFQHTEEMSLVKWLRNVMNSENPSIAIDLKLMGNGYENQMLLVLKISCFCTRDDPKQRPNSKEVGCMLSEIKH